MFNYNTADMGL